MNEKRLSVMNIRHVPDKFINWLSSNRNSTQEVDVVGSKTERVKACDRFYLLKNI